MLGFSKQPPVLNQGHVDRLLRDRSPSTRAETAASVAAAFADGDLAPRERRMAEGILGLLAADVADEVRESLAEHIKHSPLLPRSLAVSLAHDIESVALPILRASEVLTDDDLIGIVRVGNEAKQFAIAERRTVSESVADALVETGRKGVICVLLANDGAQIAAPSLETALAGFQDDEDVTALMVERRSLPVAVTERLVTTLSETLRERLIQRHNLPESLVAETLLKFAIINLVWIPIHLAWLAAGNLVNQLDLAPRTHLLINRLMAMSLLVVVGLAWFSVP